MCLKQRALLLSTLVAGIATHSNALPGVHARPAPAEWRYITDVEGRRVRLVDRASCPTQGGG